MDRIVSFLMVILLCIGSAGGALASQEATPAQLSASTAAQDGAALKKDGVELSSADSLALYDVVTFGRYRQDTSNDEPSDIEWIVIGFDGDDRVKLLSRYALDSHRFQDPANAVSWTSTSLYLWLNGAFKASAFTEEEQALLATGVSVPSVDEAKELPVSIRQCSSTPYARKAGAGQRCVWWLNDHGARSLETDDEGEKISVFYASAADHAGEIITGLFRADRKGIAVRPMILVDMDPDAAQRRESAVMLRRGVPIGSASELELYDVITFGRYVQAPDTAPDKIEWLVMGIDGEQVKLMSKYCLDMRRYHDVHDEVTWESSHLYAWLNDGFKNAAFSPDEQAMLADGVTLPDAAEAEDMPVIYRGTASTAYAIDQGAGKKNCIWWLSGPTEHSNYWNSSNLGWFASAVNESGEILKLGYRIDYGGKAIRPTITVDLSKLPQS